MTNKKGKVQGPGPESHIINDRAIVAVGTLNQAILPSTAATANKVPNLVNCNGLFDALRSISDAEQAAYRLGDSDPHVKNMQAQNRQLRALDDGAAHEKTDAMVKRATRSCIKSREV